MRIGLVSREFPPFFGGGVGTYVYQMSRALAKENHEVHVFTVKTDKSDNLADPPGVTVHRSLFDPPDPFSTGMAGPWTRANEWFHTAGLFYESLMDFLAGNKLDIVEFTEWEAPGWMLFMDPKWTVPSVVMCHTPTWFLQELNRQAPLNGQEMELFALAMADSVCAPCTPMANRTESAVNLSKPVTVIPYPYFADDVNEKYTPADSDKILFIGRLERRKGVVELGKALNIFLDKHKNARFHFVGGDTPTAPGGGSMKEYLSLLIGQENSSRVRFLDNMPADSLYKLYQSSLFCVFPSIFENFPNVCLEAMASGRTAIVGNDSGMVEMMGDSGIPVNQGDIDTLAEKISFLFENRDHARRLGKRAFKRVRKQFAPGRIVKRKIEYYNKVINENGSSIPLEKRTARVHHKTWAKSLAEITEAMCCLHGDPIKNRGDIPNPIIDRILQKIPRIKKNITAALYGAGRHTQKIIPDILSLKENGINIEMILDDNPKLEGKEFNGIKVFPPEKARESSLDCIILSSDAMESLLWEKSRPLREAGIATYRLYEPDSSLRKESGKDNRRAIH